jgi:C_GCAxxG_C_C family probable redox protein
MVEPKIILFPELFKKEAEERARAYLEKWRGCAQQIVGSFQTLLGMEDELVFKGMRYLGGGVAATGHTCGSLIGGVFVLGMRYGLDIPSDRSKPKEPGEEIATELVEWFEAEFGTTECRAISKVDLLDPVAYEAWRESGGNEICMTLIGKTAKKAAELIIEHG